MPRMPIEQKWKVTVALLKQ